MPYVDVYFFIRAFTRWIADRSIIRESVTLSVDSKVRKKYVSNSVSRC